LDRGQISEIRHKETEIQHAQDAASVHPTKCLFSLDLNQVIIFCHDFVVLVSENISTTIVTFAPKQNANTMTVNPTNNVFSLRAKLRIFSQKLVILVKILPNTNLNELCFG
jgi:hypothetical protein